MTAPAIDLSIIIPAFNEADRIADVLKQLADFLATRDYGTVEVVVVTAEAPDGTPAIVAAQAHLFQHFRHVKPGPRVGKGRDVRAGIFEATGRYRVFMDADLATPLHHLDEVKAFMDRHGQILIAVRDLFVIHKGFVRKVMSTAGNLATQFWLTPGIKDTQCGFKAFEASVAEDVFGRITRLRWSFDMEVLAIARQRGYRIETFEAPDWSDPKGEASGLVGDSVLQVALGAFLDPLKIRLGIWSGKYNKVNYLHRARS